MSNTPSITAIVMTLNEEVHLQRCIDSLKGVCSDIVIVDSFSTDKTNEIALKNNVQFFQNKWENNYAKQFNWALDNILVKTKWVLRLDADEYLTPELIAEIKEKLPSLSEDVTGVAMPLRRVFMNRIIKRGTGVVKLLRIFQFGKGRCEDRWMDEHIQLTEGKSIQFEYAFADHNLNNIDWWTIKHNGYSIREAIDLLDIEFGLLNKSASDTKLSKQAATKRNMKLKYAKQPLFWRSFVYFLYRYIYKLGFLEGKEGFLWHFLQGWWYRNLVDTKIYEIKKVCGNDVNKIKLYIKRKYGLDIK